MHVRSLNILEDRTLYIFLMLSYIKKKILGVNLKRFQSVETFTKWYNFVVLKPRFLRETPAPSQTKPLFFPPAFAVFIVCPSHRLSKSLGLVCCLLTRTVRCLWKGSSSSPFYTQHLEHHPALMGMRYCWEKNHLGHTQTKLKSSGRWSLLGERLCQNQASKHTRPRPVFCPSSR